MTLKMRAFTILLKTTLIKYVNTDPNRVISFQAITIFFVFLIY